MSLSIVVTGGAGFIGSALSRLVLTATPHRIVVVDKLTDAGTLDSLAPIAQDPRFSFVRADIAETDAMTRLFAWYEPDIVVHLAAETHLERPLDGPAGYVGSNILGTFGLLEAALDFYRAAGVEKRRRFRFHHVSTGEVFGSPGPLGRLDEEARYDPRSPYSASKAAGDHLVRAWHHTYDLPVVVTMCSDNYGPHQRPEELIPLMIINGSSGQPLPVHGEGANMRDWLYVEDHARALLDVALRGRIGETYCIGGGAERRTIEVVQGICTLLDEMAPDPAIGPRDRLVTFVPDRPGHDARYAIDASKIERDLGWLPRESFETGLAKTVRWYLDNRGWWERVRSGACRGERLGLAV